jgi:DNA-binding response OmpR family regulator
MAEEHSLLAGRAVLVVEDEPLVGLDVADALTSRGAQVVCVRSAVEALASIDPVELSVAVLDINLGTHDCRPVCQHLSDRGIPFLFHSGYSNTLDGWSDVPLLRKPATPQQIIDAVANLLSTHPTESGDGNSRTLQGSDLRT